MNINYGKVLTAFLAVLFGVFAIIRFVPDAEMAVDFLSLTFGLVAIFWTYRANASLSPGTSLREYTTYFLWSLMLIFVYSVWDTLGYILNWSGYWIYPKYFMISVSYLIFVFAAYKILYLGKEFGFQPQVEKMNLKRKKR